jgi:D-alanyl-D-alanine carboxypeptidase
MIDIYLPFFGEGPDPFGGYIGATFGGTAVTEPIDFDFASYATAAWAAGGLVSTAGDLHTLLSSLFDGSIIAPSLVEEMTANSSDGFGISAPEWVSQTPLFGHDGRIVGAGTFLLHAPETGMTVFTMSNANYLFVSPATEGVAIVIASPNVTLAAE